MTLRLMLILMFLIQPMSVLGVVSGAGEGGVRAGIGGSCCEVEQVMTCCDSEVVVVHECGNEPESCTCEIVPGPGVPRAPVLPMPGSVRNIMAVLGGHDRVVLIQDNECGAERGVWGNQCVLAVAHVRRRAFLGTWLT